MQPYRLEMGLPFANAGGKNLYEFWGDRITETLGQHLKASGSRVLVNLASNEYFKAVKPKFKGDGYYYSKEHSEGNNWVFLRDAPPQG